MMKIININRLMRIIPDSLYLKIWYHRIFGKKLNLKNPQTYNEKLQWLKLYDRNPLYTTLVDKYEVKKYVAQKIGEQYIIPTIGVWDSFDEIDFDKLPNQFVLKCTHDSGGIAIVKDKNHFDINSARKKINESINNNYFWNGREWPYKNVSPRIIAEKYIEDKKTNSLNDYKFFCFDGEIKALFIATDRQGQTETKFDFFDADFNHLELTNGHPNSNEMPKRPETFEKMKDLAAELSKGIPHVRVDFYEVDGVIFFGELTFYHWSGLKPFNPQKWDYIFGKWINLPEKRR